MPTRKWGVSSCFSWEEFGVVAPETCLESRCRKKKWFERKGKMSQEELLLRHSRTGTKCSPDTYLISFAMGDHFGKSRKVNFEKAPSQSMEEALLLSDHGLLDQLLPEYQTLIAPLHAFFRDKSTRTDHSTSHHPSLVIKIRQNNMNAFVLLA
jgi:hypothetical protein